MVRVDWSVWGCERLRSACWGSKWVIVAFDDEQRKMDDVELVVVAVIERPVQLRPLSPAPGHSGPLCPAILAQFEASACSSLSAWASCFFISKGAFHHAL